MKSLSLRVGAHLAAAAFALAAGSPRAGAAEAIRVNGSGSALDLVRSLAAAFGAAHPEVGFQVDAPLGSAGATQALLSGAIDLAVVSRAVSAEEAARGAVGRAYGRTPLVVVTHAGVPVRGLTTAELEELWSGRRRVWPGGEAVRVILRPRKETKTRLLEGLSPGMARADAEARALPWAIVAVTDPESDERVASTPGGLGAASLTSLSAGTQPLNPLTLDGVPGTVEALAEGRYRLASEVVFVTGPFSTPRTFEFLAFVWSAEGRAVARRAGVLVEASPGPPP